MLLLLLLLLLARLGRLRWRRSQGELCGARRSVAQEAGLPAAGPTVGSAGRLRVGKEPSKSHLRTIKPQSRVKMLD
jgi:hypothetical protein